MTTAATLLAEINACKSIMAGLQNDSNEHERYQVILNQMQINYLIANAGAGAALGTLSTQIALPPGDMATVGANLNEPVGSGTDLNKNGAVAALVTTMGWT